MILVDIHQTPFSPQAEIRDAIARWERIQKDVADQPEDVANIEEALERLRGWLDEDED